MKRVLTTIVALAVTAPAFAGDPVLVDTYSLSQTPQGLASGPDSRFVMSAGSTGVRVVDLLTFEAVTDFTDDTGQVTSRIDLEGKVPVDIAVTGGTTPCVVTINEDGSVTAFYYSLLDENRSVGTDFFFGQLDLVTVSDSLVALAADPDSDLVWVADNDSLSVLGVDAEPSKGLSPQPTGVNVLIGSPMRAMISAITTVGLRVYVTTSDGIIASVNNGLQVLPSPGGAPDLIDITDVLINNDTHLFVLDVTNNQVHDYNTTGNLLIASNDLPAGSTPVAISTLGFGGQSLVAVAFEGPDEVLLYDPTTWTLEYGPIALSGAAGPLVGQDIGYLFATSGTSLQLITGNPFLSGINVDPDPVIDPAAEFTFRFTSNLQVDYTLHTGGTINIEGGNVQGGTQIRNGSAAPGVEQTITVPGSELSLAEGVTPFQIIATEPVTDFIGHGTGDLNFDLPPRGVDGFHVGFGDERIFVRWEIPEGDDLDHYDIYFGTDPDAGNGLPGLSSPIRVSQPEFAVQGQELQRRLEPVVNGTTVYAYMVAVDAANNESLPSATLSATAQETQGVCGQSDCAKKCSVSSPGRDPIPWGMLGALLLFGIGGFVILRSRKQLVITAVVCAGLLGTAVTASAQEPAASPLPAESPKWVTLQAGGGVYLPDNGVIKDVYGDVNAAGNVRVGMLLFSILDLGVSVGFQQWSGNGLGVTDGTESDDLFRLTTIPISGTAIARLDFFPNQILVPYGGGGIVFLDYNERDVYASKTVRGNDSGVVFIGGIMFLLDSIEPGRAMDLDRYYGVNDIFLDIQGARFVFDNDGLDVSGWRVTASFLFVF